MACWFFGACCLLLFLCSSLYHRVRWSPRWEVLMQKIDHCSIFLMVTGAFVVLFFVLSARVCGVVYVR